MFGVKQDAHDQGGRYRIQFEERLSIGMSARSGQEDCLVHHLGHVLVAARCSANWTRFRQLGQDPALLSGLGWVFCIRSPPGT